MKSIIIIIVLAAVAQLCTMLAIIIIDSTSEARMRKAYQRGIEDAEAEFRAAGGRKAWVAGTVDGWCESNGVRKVYGKEAR